MGCGLERGRSGIKSGVVCKSCVECKSGVVHTCTGTWTAPPAVSATVTRSTAPAGSRVDSRGDVEAACRKSALVGEAFRCRARVRSAFV